VCHTLGAEGKWISISRKYNNNNSNNNNSSSSRRKGEEKQRAYKSNRNIQMILREGRALAKEFNRQIGFVWPHATTWFKPITQPINHELYRYRIRLKEPFPPVPTLPSIGNIPQLNLFSVIGLKWIDIETEVQHSLWCNKASLDRHQGCCNCCPSKRNKYTPTHTHTHTLTHTNTHTHTHRADNLIILRWRCKENDKMKPSHTFATVSYHSTIKSGQDPGPSSCGIRLMAALFIPFVYLFFLLYLLRLFLLC